MSARIAVVGTGGWGTAMALVGARAGHAMLLWGRRPEQVEAIRRERRNAAYLPDIPIPEELQLSSDPAALRGYDRILCAIPAQHIRRTLEVLRPHVAPWTRVLSLSKGIEMGSLARPSRILEEGLDHPRVTVLSGPSHAEEVARELPALVVAANAEEAGAREWQELFSGPALRLYTSDDPAGVELAGALKNVIAIAAGICDGLKLGDNAKAALLSRGIVEMARLGAVMGARKSTFFGISGIGDLITTCTSRHGRNLRVGREIGAGRPPAEVIGEMTMVAEGVWTSKAARDLGRRHEVDLPIVEEVCHILHEGRTPLEGLRSLMSRVPKSEKDDLL